MISRLNLPVLGGLTALALAGCSDNPSRNFGATRSGANEIRVTAPPSLAVPPVMSQRAPRPGTSEGGNSGSEADSGGTGYDGAAAGTRVSAGQDALIEAAGPAAPADIRQQVSQDAQLRRQDPAMTDALLFGQSSRPTPLIQSGSKSWMDSIF